MKSASILFTALCLLAGSSLSAQDTVKYVKTLDGAYLNSSDGTDRLGGNKMGYIDKDIVFQVLDSNESLYKIRLSENRAAFIPIECVADTVLSDFPRVAVSGSISVTNAGESDRIHIGLDSRKCYMIRQETNPEKMIIDLYGVQNNSNWITQYLNLESVGSIEAVQIDSDIMRLTVGLKNKTSWGYSARYEESGLVIEIRHLPELTLKGMVIGIDAGHGGPDSPGARGRISGVNEKDLNLDMALRLKRLLEAKGAKTVLSREKDTSLSMTERKAIFLANNVDMAVSIHCNAGGTASGTSTYYKHIQNRKYAQTVLESVLEIDGINLFGLVGNFNFSLNAPTEYPNTLVETLFLSDPEDEARLNDPKFRELIMSKVAKGIENYIKYCKKAEK